MVRLGSRSDRLGYRVQERWFCQRNPTRFQPDSDDIVTHETESILGKGSIRWVEEDGNQYWRLGARSADARRFCLCTICYADPSERNLALEIWRSLTV